jgi:uncharacterized damage-inducible protein DinB
MKLSKTEFAPFYENYITLAKNLVLSTDFDSQMNFCVDFYTSVPKDKLDYRYEASKWSIKDILLHVIDCERIFAYRALCIARKDRTLFPGFEENDYAVEARGSNRSFESLIHEYKSVRHATKSLFESFEATQLTIIGNASGKDISVRAIGYIILGHELHHINIIKERYL